MSHRVGIAKSSLGEKVHISRRPKADTSRANQSEGLGGIKILPKDPRVQLSPEAYAQLLHTISRRSLPSEE